MKPDYVKILFHFEKNQFKDRYYIWTCSFEDTCDDQVFIFKSRRSNSDYLKQFRVSFHHKRTMCSFF